ncbi:MAG: TlpA disulfide reductase family protein [Bryobacteraceae bacterium]
MILKPSRRDVCLMLGGAAAAQAALTLPKPSPSLVFRTTTGQIDIASYKGKVLGIEFLLTTCPHCQNCSRVLQKMQTEFGSRGFQALGIAVNDMSNMLVDDYVKNLGLSFPVGFAPKELPHQYLEHPIAMIMYYPQLVFIDRAGVIRAHYPGGDKFYQEEEKNMRAQIETLLGAAKPATSAKGPAKKK